MEIRETVTFYREDLLEFFGKMALPPWTDESGMTIGQHIDCAPIASEIERWVAANQIEPAANLGCATTEQLLNELTVRAVIGGYSSYRTVDGD